MKKRRRQPARDSARRWLINALACGPVTVEAIRWQAHKAGIAWATLRRARVGVAVSERIGAAGGYWIWKMLTVSVVGAHREGVCPVCGRDRGVAR